MCHWNTKMGSALTSQQVSVQSKVTGQFDTNTKLGGQKSVREYTAWPDLVSGIIEAWRFSVPRIRQIPRV